MKLCECGCGKPTRVSERNRYNEGAIKGVPRRFIQGHHTRTIYGGERHHLRAGDELTYGALHRWIARRKQRTGTCVECGATPGGKGPAGTHWANISGEYRRDVDDFRELCPKCNIGERECSRRARAAA